MKAIFAAPIFPPMKTTNEIIIGQLSSTQSSLLAAGTILLLMFVLVAVFFLAQKVHD
jgi:hypothetical protein